MPGVDEELISYDRLHVHKELHDTITVRTIDTNQYTAQAVPSTYTLGPANAKNLLQIRDLEIAIQQSANSTERIKFLIGRLGYWRKWACSRGAFFYNPADRE